MAIILRSEKGSPLTHNELDQNFRELIYSSSVSGSVVTLHRFIASESTTPVVSLPTTGSVQAVSSSIGLLSGSFLNTSSSLNAVSSSLVQTQTILTQTSSSLSTGLQKVYPVYNYDRRIALDSGSILNMANTADLYQKNLSLLDSTVFLWSGVSGIKTRTSGSNTFASKLYNMANKVQQFGTELVTNGTFTTNTTGWTPYSGAVLSIDNFRLKVLNNSEAYARALQTISVISGKTYHLSFSLTVGTCPGSVSVGVDASTNFLSSGTITSDSTKTLSFVAPLTGLIYVKATSQTTVIGEFCFFDNISVKQMDWIEGTNGAVQTIEANQPYMGGLIALNEVGKLKSLSIAEDRKINFSNIVFSENDNWSVSFAVKLFDIGTQIVLGQSNNFGYIGLTSSAVRILSYFGVVTSFSNSHGSSEIGKTLLYTVTHIKGNFSLYKDGRLISSLSGAGGISFNQLLISGTSGNDLIGELPHLQIFNRALSASEIQAQHDFLRLQIPEIEGIAIGNQYWATSNYEGVVAGDGSVIQEVQNSDNVERITDVRDREFSEDTGFWTKTAQVTINSGGSGVCNIKSTDNTQQSISRVNVLTVGKWYRIGYDIKRNAGGSLQISDGNFVYNVDSTVSDGKSFYILASFHTIRIRTLINADIDIDNVSVQEVGWSQSTALYDAIYAQTSGTAAVKELAALKAAAMWSYYNNDVNNGAIYGKLYNWYAVKLISLYPPQGYRVPTSADFIQLQTYLGGSTVAGGKMKALYGGFNNSFSTNESGFSATGAGQRVDAGSFAEIEARNSIWTQSDSSSTTGTRPTLVSNSIVLDISNTSKVRGFSIRLLRNSPVGPNEKTITSTTIVSDIASTANSTQIPFGYSVASIRLKTTANLTNIKVELWNNFYSGTPALVSTLITGKTANNTTMVFPVLADSAALLQDGNLRITATGAATFETIVEYNLQKNTF